MNAVQNPPEATGARTSRGRWKLIAVLLVCAAPVIASYLTYYVIRPEGRTNYGELIEPMPAITGLAVGTAAGAPSDLGAVGGKWTMVVIEPGDCAKVCQDRLYAIRQVRLTTGKERERVERLLLLTSPAVPAPEVLAGHEGLHLRRAAPAAVAGVFPAPGGAASDHIYVVDPLGNVMMRFPADADPSRMKKDLAKLLRASRIG
ncbi:cytochrome C oxidase subunit I [Quisquiliibacterium transsilvanicum]|uniref:Cytochrome C oxidase subunit I n=1 Tax=Quisquiliibacterium transsilvanicum TaxID=1549638 RepID=A0A7W8HL67_9BURK|nr:hypothetical protein [Quisquiliibacterium transsilvanicum]